MKLKYQLENIHKFDQASRNSPNIKWHINIYVKTEVKIKLKELKDKMTSPQLKVNDIQSFKHPDSAIKYITD